MHNGSVELYYWTSVLVLTWVTHTAESWLVPFLKKTCNFFFFLVLSTFFLFHFPLTFCCIDFIIPLMFTVKLRGQFPCFFHSGVNIGNKMQICRYFRVAKSNLTCFVSLFSLFVDGACLCKQIYTTLLHQLLMWCGADWKKPKKQYPQSYILAISLNCAFGLVDFVSFYPHL